jgi:nucleoside-diphosphate-sugar epimerase
MSYKQTILITGATGFLGSHVLAALTPDKNTCVIAACRNPSKLPPDFQGEIRQGDLTDSNYVRQLTQGVDVVCHTAAWTSLWAHRKEEQRLFRDPTLALVDAAVASGVQRFIFDSSVVVTGPHRDGTAIGDHEPARHPGFWPHVDMVADIENHMRQQSGHGTTMIALRCGHFAGERYNLGLLSLLLPRLKTHLVPWVAGGRAHAPLVDGRDLGSAYALAASAEGLAGFESFNICGPSFPRMTEVIDFLHVETGVPRPHFGVPLRGAYVFGWLMEKLNPLLPGDPFLTRAIVFLGEDWYAPSDLARERLGYEPKFDWKTAIRHQLKDMERQGYSGTPLVDGLRWWAR